MMKKGDLQYISNSSV